MCRIAGAVPPLAPGLAACGTERAPDAPPGPRGGDTLLARVGGSLVAVHAGTGRTLQTVTSGAHDASLAAVYTAVDAGDAGTTVVVNRPGERPAPALDPGPRPVERPRGCGPHARGRGVGRRPVPRPRGPEQRRRESVRAAPPGSTSGRSPCASPCAAATCSTRWPRTCRSCT